MTDIRLVAYAPNAGKLGPLPTPEDASVSVPLNDLGAVSLKYPPVGARTDLLGQPLEVAVEVSHDQGLTWAEPPSGRFLYLRDGRDPLKDDSYGVECPAYVTRLEKALVDATALDEEGKRTFTDATPGAILRTLLDEAQARGALTGMSWTFTATNDSAGVPWPASSRQTVGYEAGTSLLAILLGLAEGALVDFRTNGRGLEVFVAETATGMGADRTVGANPVTLRYGRDLTEAPFRRTWEGLADTALVKGDAGTFITRANGSALKPWGRQETFITASGVTDTGTLNVLADAHLSLTAEERAEFTVGLDFSRAVHLPLRDYSPGEYVFRATEDGGLEKVRVHQITLTLDNQGRSGGNAVLNDRFLEQDVRTQRRIAAVTGGSSAATPGQPTPAGNDILAPAKPTGLDHTTSAYLASRVPSSQVTLSWLAVTTNADGTPISDLDHYEIWRRSVSEGLTAWNHVATVQADRTTWSDSPYAPGSQWEFRIRAVDNVFNWSAFSDPEPVTMASDVTAPPKPSAPVLGSRNGNLEASWDGLAATGGAMPGDLQRVEVHRSSFSDFIPEARDRDTLASTLFGPGVALVSTMLESGVTYYVRLLAVDQWGNVSEPSDQDSVEVEGIPLPEPAPAPSSSPAPTVTPLGILALQAAWAPIVRADRYDIYVSDAPMAGADPGDLLTTVTGTQAIISRLPSGAPLTPNVPTYVRVVAGNDDGNAAVGPEVSGIARLAESGDISPSYVYTGGVSANQIETGELSAALALVGGLTAGVEGGRSIVLDGSEGFRVVNAAGETIVHFPLDPDQENRFTGDLVAAGFTTTGRAQFRGVENEISTASIFTLANGVTAPANAPTVGPWLPSVFPTGGDFGGVGGSPIHIAGFWYEGGKVYSSSDPGYYGTSVVTAMNAATGAADATVNVAAVRVHASEAQPNPPSEAASVHRSSQMVSLGGEWLRLEARWLYGPGGIYDPTSRTHWYLVRYNKSGAQIGSWSWEPWNQWGQVANSHSPSIPTLSVDGSNLLIAQVNPSGQLRVTRHARTTGTLQGSALTFPGLTVPSASGYPVAQVLYGNFDFGAARYVVRFAGERNARVFNSSGVEQASEAWPILESGATLYAHQQVTWDGTRFLGWGYSSIYRFSTAKTPVTYHLAYTWYDSTTEGTGTHETTLSPVATTTTLPRWGITSGAPTGPPGNPEDDDDAPDAWRMYAAAGATYPGPGNMKLQPSVTMTYDIFGTPWSFQVSTIYDALADGSVAPSVNSFPDGKAAELKSEVGGFIVRGDGTGSWPALTDAVDDKLVEVEAALAEVQASSSGGAPIGSEMVWPGPASTVPNGWLVEDGAQVLISSYPVLYDRLTNGGTTFPHGANTNGSGAAGSTHFRLPDSRGRVPVGQDTTQAEFDTIGEKGGAKTHTLTVAEMPSHNHGGSTTAARSNANLQGEQMTREAYFTNIYGLLQTSAYAGRPIVDFNQAPEPPHAHGISSQGGGGAHNNLQPYRVGLWIIKASNGDQDAEPAPTYADLATTLRAKVVTLTNVTLSGLQVVDGYTLLEGDVVLVAGQTTGANNGPYRASAGAWTRHPLADSTAKLVGMEVVIERGAAHGGKRFTPTGWKTTDTLGTTAQVWKSMGALMAPVMLRASASPQLTTSLEAIPGLSHAITVESSADVFDVNMVMDVAALNTASWLAVGSLFVDGVAVTGSCVVSGTTTNQRVTSAQNYQVSGLTPGTHTLEMRANKSGTPTVQLYAGHTSMSIKQLPTHQGDVAASLPTATVSFASNNNHTGNNTAIRSGKVVTLEFNATASVARGAAEQFAVVPDGFRPSGTQRWFAMDLGSAGVVPIYVDGAGRCVHIPGRSAGQTIVGSITYVTL